MTDRIERVEAAIWNVWVNSSSCSPDVKGMTYEEFQAISGYPKITEMKAVLRLEAQAAIEAAEVWQPIETAPRDGTPIQAEIPGNGADNIIAWYDNFTDDTASWVFATEQEPPECWTDGVCWLINEEGKPSVQPTRWKPAPPEQAQSYHTSACDRILGDGHKCGELGKYCDYCLAEKELTPIFRAENARVEKLFKESSNAHSFSAEDWEKLNRENTKLREALAQAKTNIEFMVHGEAGAELVEFLDAALQEDV
ncbi:MAG: hypothetical protein V7727_19275 [Sneathiella sp.]